MIIHRADERGKNDLGWLKSSFSFSFANYHNPQRMGFGKLRVLNDDYIAQGKGFGAHQHSNMEIITIPLSGELVHKDSIGKKEVLVPGQIQAMSAGSGITHSEFNNSTTKPLELFQIWIETKEEDILPRHETKTLSLKDNKLTKIVSGIKSKDTLYIHQDASIHLGNFTKEEELSYKMGKNHGVFIMAVEGSVKVENETLNKRDSVEITGLTEIKIKPTASSKLILIDLSL